MTFEPGTPSGYFLAIMGMTFLSIFFFGVAGTLIAGFFYDIGYSVDPLRCGQIASVSFGVLTFVIASVVSYRDYHFQPPSEQDLPRKKASHLRAVK